MSISNICFLCDLMSGKNNAVTFFSLLRFICLLQYGTILVFFHLNKLSKNLFLVLYYFFHSNVNGTIIFMNNMKQTQEKKDPIIKTRFTSVLDQIFNAVKERERERISL